MFCHHHHKTPKQFTQNNKILIFFLANILSYSKMFHVKQKQGILYIGNHVLRYSFATTFAKCFTWNKKSAILSSNLAFGVGFARLSENCFTWNIFTANRLVGRVLATRERRKAKVLYNNALNYSNVSRETI